MTITAPVAETGTITIIRGDDYLNKDGRAISFTIASGPTLTAGTVALRVQIVGAIISYAGVITGAAACYVELTTAQSALLPVSDAYPYDLQATLSNGSIVTLLQGTLVVRADVR